jgi:hypothetical protein
MDNEQPTVPNTDGDPAIAEALAAIEIKPTAPDEAFARHAMTSTTVDAWFNEMFHNSLVSRDPQIFNYCQAAKEELKRRLAAL